MCRLLQALDLKVFGVELKIALPSESRDKVAPNQQIILFIRSFDNNLIKDVRRTNETSIQFHRS